MSRQDDTKSAIRALNTHIDVIDDVCYSSRGQIDDIPENEKVITALRKNRLAYYLDDCMGVQVHSKVRGILDHVTNRHRFRERNGEFASFIDNLEIQIQSYKQNKSRNMDADRYFGEVRETVFEITEALTETVNMFHQKIENEFSIVSDIDERIKQTSLCKNAITKLNGVFSQLSVDKMNDWVGLDLVLERLLMKYMKKHVDGCLRDLSTSNRKLVKMLDKLMKDKSSQKLNSLIDSFHGKFIKEPGYQPNISSFINLPESFSFSYKLDLGSYPDTDSTIDQDTLIELSLSTLKKSDVSQKEPIKEEAAVISDERAREFVEDVSPLIENIDFFFEVLNEDDFTSISAMDAYFRLGVETDAEDWMLMIMTYFEAQRKSILRIASMREVREITQPFDGTIYVKDMVFSKGKS